MRPKPRDPSRAVRVLEVKLDPDRAFDWDELAHTVREGQDGVRVHARSIVASLSVLNIDFLRACGSTFQATTAEAYFLYVIQYRDGDNWVYHSQFCVVSRPDETQSRVD